MLGRGRCEVQYQMSDEFYIYIINFMKTNNMNLRQLAKYINIEEYLLYKILNRKIKMACYMSLLMKIANATNALTEGIKLGSK